MIEAVLKGFGLGLLLSISVGPVIFTVLKQSINNGFKGGLSFISGVFISDLLLVVLGNVFAALFVNLLQYSKPVGIVGSVLIVTLGVYFLFIKKIDAADHTADVQRSGGHYIRIAISGFLMNTLNPGVIGFWFVTTTANAAFSQLDRIIMFSICLMWNLAADLAKVFFANKIRKRLTVHNIRLINKISGGILIVFGFAIFGGILIWGNKLK